MFDKFLKRKERLQVTLEKNEKVVINNPIIEKKSNMTMEQLIQEIHDTFYSEVDRLEEFVSIKTSLESKLQPLIDKRERLIVLGFTNTKEVRDTDNEIKRLETLKLENLAKEKLANAINYFKINYPTYKFITEESIKNICIKYNLVHGPVSAYIGTVPDKNLKEMENFKLRKEDECYEETKSETNYNTDPWTEYKKHSKFMNYNSYNSNKDYYRISSRTNGKKCTTSIAAPLKDFDISKLELQGHKLVTKVIEIPDPVVTEPVFYEGERYFLIKTAWGLESTDPEVFNELIN